MTEHYPLLHALRAARARAEAEITAPVRARLRDAEDRARASEEALQSLATAMAGKVADRALEEIAFDAKAHIRRALQQAYARARGRDPLPPQVTITIDVENLNWIAEDELFRAVVRSWRDQTVPKARARARPDMATAGHSTILFLEFPGIGVSIPIARFR